MTGIVKFYNETKGVGFIKSDEDGAEVFVHTTGLVDNVKENDRVEFDVIKGKKGPTPSTFASQGKSRTEQASHAQPGQERQGGRAATGAGQEVP